jgi:putative FmdB family regulatory protein
MPLYEYQCTKCGHRLEKIQRFSDKPLKKCPECGGPLEKVISAPAVQFKGSGWYVSDYARKGASAGASSENESTSKETGTKESKESKESKDSKDSKETKEAKKEEKAKPDSFHKKQKRD